MKLEKGYSGARSRPRLMRCQPGHLRLSSKGIFILSIGKVLLPGRKVIVMKETCGHFSHRTVLEDPALGV